MKKYHLYLDESESYTKDRKEVVFCLAGIIVEEDKFNTILEPELNVLKNVIWNDLPNPTSYVLHEKDVRSAQHNKLRGIKTEFHRFKKSGASRVLYRGIDNVIKNSSCVVIGASIHMNQLDTHFKKSILSDNYLIAFQIILENYCHYLESVNGIGSVFYESREDKPDSITRMQFNRIKAMGSMYVNAYAMQRHIREIEFPAKKENNAGLQIADFVPNPFARIALGLKQQQHNIYKTLRKSRYHGGIYKGDRFGVKLMP